MTHYYYSVRVFHFSATGVLEWILNGERTVLVCDDCDQLRYIIDTIEFDDAGEYTCRANLTDGSMLGPESAGFLTVLGVCVCLFVCV